MLWQRRCQRGVYFSWLAVICILITTALSAAPKGKAETRARQQLKQVQRDIKQVAGALHSKQQQQSALQAELKRQEIGINTVSRALRNSEQRLHKKQSLLRKLQEKQERARAVVAKQRQLLARQLRVAFMLSRQSPLKWWLSPLSNAQHARMAIYLRYVTMARTQQLKQLYEALSRWRQLTERTQAQHAQLQILQAEQADKRRQLRERQQARKKVLTAINAQIQSQTQQLAHLRRNEKGLQRLLRTLRPLSDIPKHIPGDGPITRQKGRLPWPVRGRVLHRFGEHRLHDTASWRGLLIAAKPGQVVRAIYTGRVIFANWLRGFGLLVIVDHGQGYMSLYGHNQSLYREVGDWVQKGDELAQVGQSGGAHVSGLYFEIRYSGKPINPIRWLR